ncbi:MAG TPA: hypothetical protein VM571_01545 [Noviherbaspirillum sp.]|nr:hypothetical protein [Noviherbaspirillum sp.]
MQVVTHSPNFGETKDYPHPIHFLPDTAVCEYVDSEGLGIVNSREGYAFEYAKALKD